MNKEAIQNLFQKTEGVLHLAPTWVPRLNNEPGRRLRLHPDDYYAFGLERGAITERWFGSVTPAMNGPKTEPTEGMSFVIADENSEQLILFKDVVEVLGANLIGEELMERYGTWPTFAKIYDNDKPLFHHLHLTEEEAQRIGCHGKPEAYYFPRQYNPYMGRFPVTYFGFDPSTDKEIIRECICNYTKFDTRITEYSRAFRIQLGTGWYTPPGVIHAPASLATYEPQWNSDVSTIMENVTMGEVNSYDMLVHCQPEDEKGNIDKLFDQIDWEESTRLDYKEKYFRPPVDVPDSQDGMHEKWVCYGNEWISAKEVTIEPGKTVILKDKACYCGLFIQGFGKFGVYNCETPEMIRFGQMTGDEYFVSEDAAKRGIIITNFSCFEPLVLLQNFANNNPDTPPSPYKK